jgi:hypothetical protein
MKTMGIRNYSKVARDWKEWKRTVLEAKVHMLEQ